MKREKQNVRKDKTLLSVKRDKRAEGSGGRE